MTGAYIHENLTDPNDYMMLIKSQLESEHDANDYQSLQSRNQLSGTDPDYNYTNSLEDNYQPLLLESIEPIKHSRDSTYQILFPHPHP